MTSLDALPGDRPPRIAVVALCRGRRVLLVADRRRSTLRLPGAEAANGEAPREALLRGCREELSANIDPTTVSDLFTVLGSCSDGADTDAEDRPAEDGAAEDGALVSMTVYSADTADDPRPTGNVDSLVWATSADATRCTAMGTDILARLAQLDLID